MFHDIPSPNFGLNFDPSHSIWQQMDYLAPLAEFRDRIFHVHAKDARIDRAALDQHGVLSYPKLWHTPKIPGLGDVRWGAFFGALSDTGYKGHVAIEVEDRAFEGSLEARLDSLVISRRYLLQYHQGLISFNDVDAIRRGRRSDPLDLSVLIPVFNEVDNVEPLHAELDAVLRDPADPVRADLRQRRLDRRHGRAARGDPAARPRARAGRVPSAELRPDRCLVGRSRPGPGEILFPMDGDRQNDPAESPGS